MAPVTSRREALKRLALGGLVMTGAGGMTYAAFDPAAPLARDPRTEPQVRSYGVPARPDLPALAVAKSSRDAGVLTRRAVEALGGIGRFVARGDVVALKPNI